MLALTILPLLAAATIAAFGCSSTPRPAAEGGQSPDDPRRAVVQSLAGNPVRAVVIGGVLEKGGS